MHTTDAKVHIRMSIINNARDCLDVPKSIDTNTRSHCYSHDTRHVDAAKRKDTSPSCLRLLPSAQWHW